MTSTRVPRPRVVRPWWFRLGAWLMALGVVLTVVVVVVNASSYGTTEHTTRSQPLSLPNSPPPPNLAEVATFPATAQLSGPVVVEVDESTAVASGGHDGSPDEDVNEDAAEAEEDNRE